MSKNRYRSIVPLALALVTAGCGGVVYTARIISASQAVEQAREAGAAELAPYEYFYALEHLEKAREEAGEAEYQDASEFAGVAEEFGTKALRLARERRMREREDATRPVTLDRPLTDEEQRQGASEGTEGGSRVNPPRPPEGAEEP